MTQVVSVDLPGEIFDVQTNIPLIHIASTKAILVFSRASEML